MQNNNRPLLTLLLVAVMAVWVGTPAFAQDLLVTGQTTPAQADNNDGIPGPVAVEDDGTLQLGLPLQYLDTGLTIIDLNTGLEWEKKNGSDSPNEVPNFANLHDVDNFYLWSGNGTQETIWDWLDDVNAEGFAGHNDWRIPSIRELESIVHYGAQTPAIDPIFDPTANHFNWSSTSDTSSANAMRSWALNFENGKTLLVTWSIAKWVRAVRTASAAANQPPVAEANGPYSGAPNAPISFSSAGSSDPDGSIASHSWDFGDGSAPSSDPNPSHTYTSAGSFTATLTVTDNQGATDTDTATVTVSAANQPPVAEANGPYSGKRNIPISFSSAGSSDPDGSIASHSWNFGDGSAPSSAPNPSHVYTSIGSFTATLTVTDNQGATDTDTAAVTVTR